MGTAAELRPSERGAPSAEPAGTVYHIMRYCLHDGPGIRTTVFFKGCPLRCWWCHNPESQAARPELMYFAERCLRCGDCVPACPEHAIRLENETPSTSAACKVCGTCVDTCPANARELVGRRMTVSEALREIEKDRVFYAQSGGGVTFSGGEPLLQPAFLEALVDACRVREIHTVLETSGYGGTDVMRRLRRKVGLFYYDLKLVDSEKHQHFTGVRNELILMNLKVLAEAEANVVVRIPLIPGVNDDAQGLTEMVTLLARLGLRKVHLLPYHQIGIEKYRRLALSERMHGVVPPTAEQVRGVAAQFERAGCNVKIGG